MDEQAQLLGFLDARSRRVEGALQEQRIKVHAAQTLLRELDHTVTGKPVRDDADGAPDARWARDHGDGYTDRWLDEQANLGQYGAASTLPLVYPPQFAADVKVDSSTPPQVQALNVLDQLRRELDTIHERDDDGVSLAPSDRERSGPYGIMGPPPPDLTRPRSPRHKVVLHPPRPTRAHLLRHQAARTHQKAFQHSPHGEYDTLPSRQSPSRRRSGSPSRIVVRSPPPGDRGRSSSGLRNGPSSLAAVATAFSNPGMSGSPSDHRDSFGFAQRPEPFQPYDASSDPHAPQHQGPVHAGFDSHVQAERPWSQAASAYDRRPPSHYDAPFAPGPLPYAQHPPRGGSGDLRAGFQQPQGHAFVADVFSAALQTH